MCQVINFPGGKVAFTSEMRFISDSAQKRVPCYRVLDDNGELMNYSNYVQVSQYSQQQKFYLIFSVCYIMCRSQTYGNVIISLIFTPLALIFE